MGGKQLATPRKAEGKILVLVHDHLSNHLHWNEHLTTTDSPNFRLGKWKKEDWCALSVTNLWCWLSATSHSPLKVQSSKACGKGGADKAASNAPLQGQPMCCISTRTTPSSLAFRRKGCTANGISVEHLGSSCKGRHYMYVNIVWWGEGGRYSLVNNVQGGNYSLQQYHLDYAILHHSLSWLAIKDFRKPPIYIIICPSKL